MTAYRRDFEDTMPAQMPAEASTELGFERSPAPRIPRRARMGPLQGWERRMLNQKACAWAIGWLAVLVLILWSTKP